MKQAKKYPAPQISEAVFRGRNSLYNFEVYPMNVRFNEVPAVYIISRRKIDRHGKGHHFLVCIGQTESLVEDIKKHKRGRCVKQLQADTVSVILEDDEQKRLEVENDIKAAHTIPCRRETADAEFVFKPSERLFSQNVKPETKKKVSAPRQKQKEVSAKPLEKTAKKQAEVKAEAKIEASKPKKAKQDSSVENKAKADSKKISAAPKKQKAEKPKTNIAQPVKNSAQTKIKSKAQTVEAQKTEAAKAKKVSASTGKTKADKKPLSKKVEVPKPKAEVSKPKNVNQAKPKVEKKQATPKSVPALKKSPGNQIKPKAKSKADQPTGAERRGALEINKAKANQPKTVKAKTVETPKKTAKKVGNAKTTETVKALKTKTGSKPKTLKTNAYNKSKAGTVRKPENKIKISAEAKAGRKSDKTKAGADLKTVKQAKTKETKSTKTKKNKAPEFNGTKKAIQAKINGPKAKEKPETRKSAKPDGNRRNLKAEANTKPKISIKSSVKGKENRLKTSPRKRLAF